MKLADEAVVAARLRIENAAAGIRADEGGATIGRRRYSPVTVSCLDGGAVKDEENQQQPEPPLKGGATVLK